MYPIEITNKKILLSCLNWGMGHISRCIPLIDTFIKNNNKIYIAGNLDQISVFKEYFPNINPILHENYPFNFKGKGNFTFDIFTNANEHLARQKKEIIETEDYVDEYKIDIVISDQRYGFFSKNCYNIFITHQLNLPVHSYQFYLQWFHEKQLKKYDEIWVPDDVNSSLSGKLSKNTKFENVTYIGPLSRFTMYEKPEKTIEELVILSGPIIYAQQLFDQIIKTKHDKMLFIGNKEIKGQNSNFLISNSWTESDKIILKAKKIIAYAGYSTLMDIHELKVDYELYATVGQAEQKYLKHLWESK